MKKVVKVVFILLLFSLMSLLMACNSEGNNSSSKSNDLNGSNEKTGEKKVLKVWSRDNVSALLETPVETFNKSNDQVEIELTSVPAEKFSEQFATALSSGNTPDIVTLDLVYAPYFSSIGAFKDITDSYNNLPYKDEFVEEMVTLGNYQDVQYALPLSADVSALIYNKDHFEEAGLDPEQPPVTWDELKEYANKLTTEDKFGYTYAAGAPGTLMFNFLPYIWGNGGDILNADGTEALIGSAESIEALQFMTDLTQEDKVTPAGAPTYQGQNAWDTFTSGKASMIVYGNFKVSDLNLNFSDINYGVALIPKNDGKNHSSFIGGELIALSADSDKEEEAMEFIDYLLSEDVQVEFFAKNGTLPVRESMFDNQYFQEEPRYQVFTEALKVAETPYSTKHNQILNVWETTTQALLGEQSPKDVFQKQEEDIQRILDSE